MKYIKKVILENFQSHKYTEIEFDQYLNVIVGPSDHGKSAIIRGLKWALFNEPSGDFFIKEGEKDCSVTVIFNNDVKVKRFRSKSKNAYYLYDEKGEEMAFEGFGTKVPQEIINKTFMRKIVLDSNQSNSVNIGEQLEGPFLLSEKSSTRANAIGRLVGVHIVDDALKDTLRDIRNMNIRKKNHEEALESLEENLQDYEYLTDLADKVKQIEKLKDNICYNQKKLNRLTQILENLKYIDQETKKVEKHLERLQEIDRAIYIDKELDRKIPNFRLINNKFNNLVQINSQIKNNNKLLASLEGIYKTEKIMDIINFNYIKMIRLNSIYFNYNHTTSNIKKNNQILLGLEQVSSIEKSINLIGKKYLKLNNLLNLKYKLDKVNKSISIGTIYIEKLSNIDSIFSIQDSLNKKNNKIKTLIECRERYNLIRKRILDTEKNLINIDSKLNEQLTEYQAILTKIEICPLCFSNIDSLKINEIINNYK